MFFLENDDIRVKNMHEIEIVIRIKNRNGRYSKEISINKEPPVEVDSVVIDTGGSDEIPRIEIKRYI